MFLCFNRIARDGLGWHREDTEALAIHPITPTVLYVGAYGGGVFGLRQMDYGIYPPPIQCSR
jgi:hypothetical protein